MIALPPLLLSVYGVDLLVLSLLISLLIVHLLLEMGLLIQNVPFTMQVAQSIELEQHVRRKRLLALYTMIQCLVQNHQLHVYGVDLLVLSLLISQMTVHLLLEMGLLIQNVPFIIQAAQSTEMEQHVRREKPLVLYTLI